MAESPNPNESISSSSKLDNSLTASNAISLGTASALLIPAGKKIFNKILDSSGNSLLKTQITTGLTVLGVIGLSIGTGSPLPIIAGGISVVGSGIANSIDSFDTKIDDEYRLQLTGSRIEQYNKGSEFYD